MSTLAADADELTGTFVGFARTLRAAGVAASAGPGARDAVSAVDHLDVTGGGDVYWAGRLTLCSGPDDLDRYDRAFAAYFGGQTAPPLRSVAADPGDPPGRRPGQRASRRQRRRPPRTCRPRPPARSRCCGTATWPAHRRPSARSYAG